ncbi:GntR family transcriptional regulator [Prauserella shujinwangii]|uniref:GntR family transcriptional regulator n=1 Tax=Prauserella shujinwangii TaxID=1453103 RepID=A0A2T0LQ56_9PSEU|nr:GntR family transcriptional regulator [Prauserella shujinwangii]
MLDGQLPVGTRLPAERELADALGVSRTLVAAALDRLRADGLVASRRGAGSWIAAARDAGSVPVPERGADLIDLARAAPPAAAGIGAAVDVARRALTAELAGHGYTAQGLADLRARIAERYRARGLPTTPDQVLVTNGAHHGFALALRAFTGPGDRVLVEQPCYPNTPEAIRAAHAQPVPAPVDPVEGWDLPGIEAALRQAAPRLAYLDVDFHNPTGLRLDAEGRERLGAALARSRTPVVVDETVAELDLEGDPVAGPPPLAAFAGDWAITVGSAAKSHWGGLRLGWIRAAEEVVDRILASRYSIDLGSPVLEQLVLAELLTDPEPLLARRRTEVRELRDVLVSSVRTHLPDWTFRVPEGGLSLWCRLPEPMSTRLGVAAASHGVLVAPGPRFAIRGGFERWLRLPFAQRADRLDEAVRRLAVAAASVRPSGAANALDVPVT